MSKRHTSLKDLATELGVSISTVSRALKNHPDISPELTRKIQQLANERHYTPNPLAMGLLRQQTKMIGVIVPDINTHFYSSIISGIEKVAKEHGYFIVISSSNESMQKEIESVDNLLNSRVEGLIVCLSQETDEFSHFHKLIENEIPLVFFDRVCEDLSVPAVLANGEEATQMITRHFYENGCRRIAYISGPGHLNISRNRKIGYLKGLEECHIDFDPQLLVNCNLSIEEARLATQQLLQLPNPPDAIFGMNDTIAFAAMIEIKKQGFKIPDDISLAGFTDEFHSIVVDPPLTSVSHPTFEMGKAAAELFFELLVKGENISKRIVLPIDLVVRQSSIKN
ncbi:LacI family DNA-binding transcriptional regulator [Maribellus sp. YY47]|uniref:LacI family DNA-binding transcriptional regulator n=1 Tax=Maribellus sp. YY47 TaxID=2929486 RepID=UPI002000B165|nr:LacI family DNA-binding transcriptional regulator [Maribellus sp. YY47]MCK3684442.1 LacI family transcriptional regulator [Maribellus sp. YY47]